MTIVVDASIAAKWFLPEAGSIEAIAITKRDEPLIAPALILAEVGSALWSKLRREGDGHALAQRGLAELRDTLDELVDGGALTARALEMAFDLDHPIYDCHYLALAEARSGVVVTADKRFIAALAGSPLALLAPPL